MGQHGVKRCVDSCLVPPSQAQAVELEEGAVAGVVVEQDFVRSAGGWGGGGGDGDCRGEEDKDDVW